MDHVRILAQVDFNTVWTRRYKYSTTSSVHTVPGQVLPNSTYSRCTVPEQVLRSYQTVHTVPGYNTQVPTAVLLVVGQCKPQ